MRTTRLTLVALLAAGCSAAPPPDLSNPDPSCQPFIEGDCFLPFPSSFYEAPDPSSPTGVRVAMPSAALPKNQVGKAFDVTRWNGLDGFSPSSQIVVNFPQRVDPARLPHHDLSDYSASLKPDSAVQVLEFSTGARVPLFAEVDANVAEPCPAAPCPDQVLLVRPMVRLRPATRYVVALSGLTDRAGQPIVVKPFRALVDGKVAPGSRLATLAPRFGEILALLEAQGVPRAGLTLAWDFITSSDGQASKNLIAMRDAALSRYAKGDHGFTVTKVEDRAAPDPLARVITGSFQVPSFLASVDDPNSGLKLGPDGMAVASGEILNAKIEIVVPRCALTAPAPRPVMLYGHGLFGDADEATHGGTQPAEIGLCMVYAATNWLGLSDADVNPVIGQVFSNFDRFWFITDRLQQAQVDFVVLARLARTRLQTMAELRVRRGAGDPVFDPKGDSLIDGKELYYSGNSQGGIEGGVFLSITPDIQRGLLGVPGGVYSLMLSRSSDFKDFKAVMNITYPSQRAQQLMLAMAQGFWDQSDPIAYLGHAIKNPFPDENGKPMAPKGVLFHEGRYDSQVPNVALHVVLRETGVKALNPPVYPVYGIDGADGPLDSAYTSWDVHPSSIPDDVDTPSPMDNGVHGEIRKLPQAIDQMKQFLRPGGRIVQTCVGGPCEVGKGLLMP